jgi:hypothetical protein
VLTGITGVVHIATKQDMSRWTRAHADVPGINWSVFAGPGGTMIIVEYAADRCSPDVADISPEDFLSEASIPGAGLPGGGLAEPAGAVRLSA